MTPYLGINHDPFSLITPLVLCLISSLLSIILRKGVLARLLVSALTSIASAIIIWISVNHLLLHATYVVKLAVAPSSTSYVPWPLWSLTLGVDNLSAFFLLMLGLVSLAASIYSFSYLKRLEKHGCLGGFNACYPLFIATMYLVFIVRDLFWFLVVWELMTLTSQFLVSLEFRRREAVEAGLKYFTMTKVLAEFMIAGGVGAMVIATYALLHHVPYITSYSAVAAGMRALQTINPWVSHLIVGLVFLGLMVKASLVPLHVWSPDTYPEAPSNVSALLSGAMSKAGIYMMFRLFLYFTNPTILWGAVLAAIGTVTLTYGTLMALKQSDSKRLLAYHSIGQMGYVVLGLGASVALLSLTPPRPLLAGVAAFASLYHALNHSVFKSLLFLNAGSVEYVTGSRNLDILGGLGKVMPLTALTALVASFSISGVPPFNGFVSKWLIYASTMPTRTPLAICGFLAMFISSVTTASFMKFYTSLFGRPSKALFRGVREVPASMLAGQVMLAAACVVLGVLPGVAWALARPALLELRVIPPLSVGLTSVTVPSKAINIPALIAATLFPAAGITYALLSGRFKHTLKNPWACGAIKPPTELSPPARSYYEVFEEEFPWLYRLGESLHGILVVKASKAIKDTLLRAEGVVESPSPMATVTAYVLLAVFLTLLALTSLGVVVP